MKVWNTSNNWTALANEAYVDAQKISPAFTGVPTAPTAAVGTSNIQIATTAFVTAAVIQSSGNISSILGTMAIQNANAVAITGGTITGVTKTNANLSGIVTLAIADGGTGATTASGARTNLGLGTMATQNANAVAITGGTITGLSSTIAVADGGTGSTTPAGARTNLGAAASTVVITAGTGLAGGGDLSTNRTISIASNSNGFGTRYVSTGTPTGGVSGDIWYQI